MKPNWFRRLSADIGFFAMQYAPTSAMPVLAHIWEPTSVSVVANLGIMPDFGHVALEIPTAMGVYVSYWPELDSLLGLATHPFKPRTLRNPASHQIEVDYDGFYMQREPTVTIPLYGLNVERISRDWQRLSDTPYDPIRWNCAGVSKYLLLAAMRPAAREEVEQSLTNSDRDVLKDEGYILARVGVLISSRFVECAPDDIRCLAETYAQLRE